MKQILTVTNRFDNAYKFDKEVNDAINKGYELKKRKVIIPYSQPTTGDTFIHIMLYAELEADI